MATTGFIDRDAGRGPRLFFRWSLPAQTARAVVLLTHGYGEHSERYVEVIEAWTEHGLGVIAYDLRGHGRSAGPRGHIQSFQEYLDDAADVLDELARRQDWPERAPLALFGHSLGGLISTEFVLSAQSRFCGLAMTSPFFGLALEVPDVKKFLGRAMSRVLPRFAQPAGLAGRDLTHDAEIAARYDSDPLGVRRVTARWFTETERAQSEVLARAPELRLPLLCLVAGDDRVASSAAAERVVELAGSRDKEFRLLPGLYHEVLNEPRRAEYISEIANRVLGWAAAARA
jgi:alpha-beta hydrolase superfamily lysophospholipase